MRHSGKKGAAARTRTNRRGGRQDDTYDMIAMEFLRLWLGLSRLREEQHKTPRPRPPCV